MGSKGTCKAEGCQGEVRAKGYCDRHYRAWRKRRLPKARYRGCNTQGCTKPTSRRGLCADHFQRSRGKVKEAEAPVAAPPPPQEQAPVESQPSESS
jgi:hypothetical protein